MPITQYLHHQRFSPAAIRLRAMTNETETLTSGIDPASFSSVIKPTNDLFRYVNGPWIDTYRLPDDRSRYGSFDKLAEDAENQVRDILDADDCPAVKSEALYHSFLNTDAIEAAGLDPIRDELDLIDSAIDKAALTRVLGTINPAGGPDLFGLAVYGDPGDPDRKRAAIATLLEIRSWGAKERIEGCLRENDPALRLAAAEALVELEHTAALKDLKAAVATEPDPATRKGLERCLKALSAMSHGR